MKLPVPTAPEFGYSVDRPPDYAKEDPDPSSTRLLEQRLAAEADVIPPYGLGLSFVVPAPMYGSSFYARAHESARPLSDVIMSAAPEMSRVSSGFDVATNSDDHYNVNDSYNDNDDVDIDENGNVAWNAEMAAIGAQGVGVPLARQRSGSNAPTYTFTAAQLAGIGIGDSAGAPLVRERSNGPTTYTFTAERLAGVGLDDSVGGVPLTRERSGSNAPTYTFTAEQLAGVRDSHPHASGLSQSQLRERRRSRTDALSRRPPLAPLRTGYGDNPAAAASFIRPSPTVTVSEYTPRTYTFTADDLARVGDRARGGWTSSLGSGSGSGSYWKSFIPRRSSAPSAEQGHKLFRSLSRGERS
jgi:hypothetical protein